MSTTRVFVILSLTTTPSRSFFSAMAHSLYAERGMARARSRSTVFARARSRFACPTRAGFLATPIDSCSRRLNSSSVRSATFCPSSSLDISRHLTAFMAASQRPRAGHELGLDADLLPGQAEALARGRLVHALHLVQDAARLDHSDPELGVALALAHPRLRRLLRHRLVREDPDEDLAATLHAARQ